MLLVFFQIGNISPHLFLIIYQLIYFIRFLLYLFLQLIDNFHLLSVFLPHIVYLILVYLLHLIFLYLQFLHLTDFFSNNTLQSINLFVKQFSRSLTLLLQSNILFNKTLNFMLLVLEIFCSFVVENPEMLKIFFSLLPYFLQENNSTLFVFYFFLVFAD